jgi:hypothetical protein
LLTDPQVFWLHFGDMQIGPENGEQYLLDWNGRRLRIDPAQDPCAAVPLSSLEDPT